VVLIEHKKASDKKINPEWLTRSYVNPIYPPLLMLSYDPEDENESIESLVERGAGKNQAVLIDQIKAAEYHFSEGREERLLSVIDYFLKNGIDVNAKDEWGETALMAAAYYSADIVNLLLKNGAKINDKVNGGSTALNNACCYLNIDIVKLLLANGAVVDSECIFDIIEQNDSLEIEDIENQITLLQLILDNGADINEQNKKGKTALMLAIEYENKSIAEYLLQQGADVNIKDNEGGTALTYAQKNSVRILGKLRKKMNMPLI